MRLPIELAPHQIAAIDRAEELLDTRGGLILADEPGLGKSFVAAAVAARTSMHVECIVPPALVPQWRATLESFEAEAAITTHDRIVSDRFFPGTGGERLIVVDEAHAFRNPETQRYDALARRSIGARLMLVTATPICNTADDLHALVALIARDDALRAEGIASIESAFRARRADEIAIVMRELVIRRGCDVLDERWRFGSLERRVVRHDVFDAAIDSLQFPLIGGQAALLRGVLWRRLESSEAAFIESLKRQIRFYERALDCIASGRTLTKRDYRAAFGDDDGEAFQEVLFWEIFATEDARVDAAVVREEMARLDALRIAAGRAPHTKASALAEIAASEPEPMLIFTAAIATAHDVHTTLKPIRKTGIVTSHGAVPLNAIAAFSDGALDALVCTDLAAEGLNLQRAGVIVHYDLPWNPVKIDQRNGRALRIGQQREVVRAIYFLPRGRRTRVVQTIASKNRIRRRVFGAVSEARSVSSLTALPKRLPRGATAVALWNAFRRRGIEPPPQLARRYRAGLERLFGEMAGEIIDSRRVSDLTALLERERIIERGASSGPSDRR